MEREGIWVASEVWKWSAAKKICLCGSAQGSPLGRESVVFPAFSSRRGVLRVLGRGESKKRRKDGGVRGERGKRLPRGIAFFERIRYDSREKRKNAEGVFW